MAYDRNAPRIKWTPEQRNAVYEQCGPLWRTAHPQEIWEIAQQLAGIPEDKRRASISNLDRERLRELYGSPAPEDGKPDWRPKRGKKLGATHKPNGAPPQPPLFGPALQIHASIGRDGLIYRADPPPQEASARDDDSIPAETREFAERFAHRIETPPAVDETPSKYEAIGLAVSILAEEFGDIISNALTKAIADPKTAATLAGLLGRVTTHADAPAVDSEPLHAEPDESPESSESPTAARSPRSHPRERLPRVLVAGLLPDQIEVLKKSFRGRADLRFWKSSDAVSMLRKQVGTVDAAVGWVSYMNHSPDALLSSRAPTYYRARGGITSVKTQIERAIKVVQLEHAGHVAQ